MDFLDQIALTGLTVFGRHGVYDHERENGQEFTIDLRLQMSLDEAAESDDVADTVHYGELAERVAAIVGGEPVNLIETVASRIGDMVLEDRRVKFVSVTVHKPHAPIALAFSDVSVTVNRGRMPRTLQEATE
jgi:dihydroneopterin aldolase